MKKYLMELIGTFFLVLTVGCTIIGAANNMIPPLAIGAALMVMIYAGGHISGGHYNPAVTLGVWLRGKCETADVIPYWISQFLGASLAAMATGVLKANTPVTALAMTPGPGFLAEFLFTFALVFVVLNSATSKDTTGNSFYGLAIGFTVMVGAYAVGAISGAAFNPAVAFAACLLGLVAWKSLWIYIFANLLSGALAAWVFRVLNPEDVERFEWHMRPKAHAT
jgi:aquaporin Z